MTRLTFPVYLFFNNNTKHSQNILHFTTTLTKEPAHTQMSYTVSLLHAGQSDFLKATVSQWQR